jgi:hypothetical protein
MQAKDHGQNEHISAHCAAVQSLNWLTEKQSNRMRVATGLLVDSTQQAISLLNFKFVSDTILASRFYPIILTKLLTENNLLDLVGKTLANIEEEEFHFLVLCSSK